MNIAKIANKPDMSQEAVCKALRKMDKKLQSMFALIVQCSNIVETELAALAVDYLLGKKSKSPIYHGDISIYTLPLIKLTVYKNIGRLIQITDLIKLTRDTSIKIIEKFLSTSKHYRALAENLACIGCIFHESGENAEEYNKLRTQLHDIEQSMGGVSEYLYGAIGNVEDLLNQYYEIRNTIVLAYLKLNLGVACRSTTRIEDSFQNGVLGIIHAIDKSKVDELEAKIFSFANFVKWHIKNAISSVKYNTRTDIVFNIHPQTLKQLCGSSEESLKKLKGERFVEGMLEDNNIIYIPEYLQDQPKRVLDSEEKIVTALLNKDPSECDFDYSPSKVELKKEIKRQLLLREKKLRRN